MNIKNEVYVRLGDVERTFQVTFNDLYQLEKMTQRGIAAFIDSMSEGEADVGTLRGFVEHVLQVDKEKAEQLIVEAGVVQTVEAFVQFFNVALYGGKALATLRDGEEPQEKKLN